jgi:hypothetical protein
LDKEGFQGVLGIWRFTPLSNNISIISWQSVFIGGGNWNIGRKSPTCGKSPTDYHIMGVSKTPSYERDSKSQL